jgi:hypothetical protein
VDALSQAEGIAGSSPLSPVQTCGSAASKPV